MSEEFGAESEHDVFGWVELVFEMLRSKFEIAFDGEATKMDVDDAVDAIDHVLSQSARKTSTKSYFESAARFESKLVDMKLFAIRSISMPSPAHCHAECKAPLTAPGAKKFTAPTTAAKPTHAKITVLSWVTRSELPMISNLFA